MKNSCSKIKRLNEKQLYSTFNPVIKLAFFNKKNFLMTLDVFVQTYPKYTAVISTNSPVRLQLLLDKKFSLRVAQNGVFFFSKMQQYFFILPCSTTNGIKTSGRHFSSFFGGLSRQHNGTYRIQMCISTVKQLGLLLLILLKRTQG